MMRVLICGGRDYTDYRTFARKVLRLEFYYGRFDTIIHGNARGADWCAHLFATSADKRNEIQFAADWKRYGSRAGPIRNQQMLDEGKPDLIIAFPGGRGTADMVRRARKAGFAVEEVSA